MTRSKVIGGQIVIVMVDVKLLQMVARLQPNFHRLLLHEQVRSDYNKTWIIDALWEPSRYDALRGHMTRSKVIGGQIVIVMVALFQIAPA